MQERLGFNFYPAAEVSTNFLSMIDRVETARNLLSTLLCCNRTRDIISVSILVDSLSICSPETKPELSTPAQTY